MWVDQHREAYRGAPSPLRECCSIRHRMRAWSYAAGSLSVATSAIPVAVDLAAGAGTALCILSIAASSTAIVLFIAANWLGLGPQSTSKGT